MSTPRALIQLEPQEPGGSTAKPGAALGRCEYKLLSADGLAVGELNALLAQHRREGWVVAQLLLDDDDRIADIKDLKELGILLRRERRP